MDATGTDMTHPTRESLRTQHAAEGEGGVARWTVEYDLPRGLGSFTAVRSWATRWEALLAARKLAKAWKCGWPTDRIRVRPTAAHPPRATEAPADGRTEMSELEDGR